MSKPRLTHYDRAKAVDYPMAGDGGCEARRDGWTCTRIEGHDGVHGAGVDDTHVVAEWPASDQDTRTIPWPPSDELVERVASMLEATDGGDYDDIARAVLDAIGGEA